MHVVSPRALEPPFGDVCIRSPFGDVAFHVFAQLAFHVFAQLTFHVFAQLTFHGSVQKAFHGFAQLMFHGFPNWMNLAGVDSSRSRQGEAQNVGQHRGQPLENRMQCGASARARARARARAGRSQVLERPLQPEAEPSDLPASSPERRARPRGVAERHSD